MQLQNTSTLHTSNIKQGGSYRLEANAKMYRLLSSMLYKNPIRAIVRELSTNAHDAHILAGTPERPFDVNLPTKMSPMLTVRDYGPGLTHEQVEDIFTTYGKSTKDQSNDFNGALGLGSKSPFGYTSSFTVTSYLNGVGTTYMMYMTDGEPKFSIGESFDAADQLNGLEIRVPVAQGDECRFTAEAYSVLPHLPTIPNLNSADAKTWMTRAGVWDFFETESHVAIKGANATFTTFGRDHYVSILNIPPVSVRMAGVVYPIDLNLLSTSITNHVKLTSEDAERVINQLTEVIQPVINHDLIMFDVPTGAVSFAPNREELSYDYSTLSTLITIIDAAVTEMAVQFKQSVLDTSDKTAIQQLAILSDHPFLSSEAKRLIELDNNEALTTNAVCIATVTHVRAIDMAGCRDAVTQLALRAYVEQLEAVGFDSSRAEETFAHVNRQYKFGIFVPTVVAVPTNIASSTVWLHECKSRGALSSTVSSVKLDTPQSVYADICLHIDELEGVVRDIAKNRSNTIVDNVVDQWKRVGFLSIGVADVQGRRLYTPTPVSNDDQILSHWHQILTTVSGNIVGRTTYNKKTAALTEKGADLLRNPTSTKDLDGDLRDILRHVLKARIKYFECLRGTIANITGDYIHGFFANTSHLRTNQILVGLVDGTKKYSDQMTRRIAKHAAQHRTHLYAEVQGTEEEGKQLIVDLVRGLRLSSINVSNVFDKAEVQTQLRVPNAGGTARQKVTLDRMLLRTYSTTSHRAGGRAVRDNYSAIEKRFKSKAGFEDETMWYMVVEDLQNPTNVLHKSIRTASPVDLLNIVTWLHAHCKRLASSSGGIVSGAECIDQLLVVTPAELEKMETLGFEGRNIIEVIDQSVAKFTSLDRREMWHAYQEDTNFDIRQLARTRDMVATGLVEACNASGEAFLATAELREFARQITREIDLHSRLRSIVQFVNAHGIGVREWFGMVMESSKQPPSISAWLYHHYPLLISVVSNTRMDINKSPVLMDHLIRYIASNPERKYK